MALIMATYRTHFYCWRGNYSSFANGEISYFDPIARTCMRINPTKGDVPLPHWILLPVIKEADVFRNFLRLSGRISLLEETSNLNDFDFSVKIAEISEKFRFEDELHGYRACYCSEVISAWISENRIPNCKMYAEPPLLAVDTNEDACKLIALRHETYLAEEKQEEEFKKSLQ